MAVITGTFNSLVSGTISGVFQNTAGGVLSGVIGTPGPAGSAGPQGPEGPAGAPGVGVPAGGTAGQFLTKTTTGVDYATNWSTLSLAGYATESWVTAGFYPLSGNPSGFLTASSLTPYLSKAGNLSGLTSLSTARDNLQLGALDTAVFGGVTVQGSGANVAQLTPTSLSLTHTTYGSFTIQPSQGIVFPDATIQTTAFTGLSGYATESWVTSQGYLTNGDGGTVPAGGTSGQILAKASSADYSLVWESFIPGDRYLTTSTTSNTISNSNKTFTIGTGLSYTPTQNLTISYDAAHHMHGEVLTYNSGTGVLTVDIKNHTGAGTYALWVVNVGGVTPLASVAWGAITGTLSAQTDLQGELDDKLALAGGAMTGSITSSNATYDTEMAGDLFGVQLSADHTKGTTVEFDGLDTYDGANHMLVNPTGLTFPDASVQTTAGLTDAPSDSETYGRNNGAWVVAGGSSLITSVTSPLSVTSGNLTVDLSGYAELTGAVFSGTVTVGGFNPDPTPTSNGEIWYNALLGKLRFYDSISIKSVASEAWTLAAFYPLSGNPSAFLVAADIVGKAPLASPTFTGTPLSTTAAVDTNTTQIATTAYVVGQGYAKLASPTFSGTPSLPTGTTAVTQTAGNNTTAVATTAFVTAAVPAVATVAQVVAATSTTTALAPGNQGFLLTNPRLQSLAFINSSALSGSGANTTSNPQNFSRENYLASLAVGRAAFSFGVIGTANAGFGTSTAKADQVDFSKKVWISGYAKMGHSGGTSYLGDANTMCRITLGGYSTNTTGDMTLKGIGLKKVGGVSSFVTLTVHNGTSLTDVASSVTVPDGGGIFWQVYSDGTGNVTLFINGTQAATTSAGPTTATASGSACYREQVEAVTAPGVRQALDCNGGWFYTE